MIPRYLAEGETLDAPELHVEENKPGEVEDKEEEDGAQQRLRLVHLLVPVPVDQGKSNRGVLGFFSMYCIQHCFICRPSDSTVSEDAEIEPKTVATSALAVRRSNH
jgi:hypothetical protein